MKFRVTLVSGKTRDFEGNMIRWRVNEYNTLQVIQHVMRYTGDAGVIDVIVAYCSGIWESVETLPKEDP